ncbi:hypothetical protein RB195_005421 [Necator americanus]|uniref:Uncharacterized protein n=1 Tax=Necator americanus TaxID=51031 RepID=A0ABR1BQT0_NECAM
MVFASGAAVGIKSTVRKNLLVVLFFFGVVSNCNKLVIIYHCMSSHFQIVTRNVRKSELSEYNTTFSWNCKKPLKVAEKPIKVKEGCRYQCSVFYVFAISNYSRS